MDEQQPNGKMSLGDCIKDLLSRIDNLVSENEYLRAENARREERIARLEAELAELKADNDFEPDDIHTVRDLEMLPAEGGGWIVRYKRDGIETWVSGAE